MSIRLSKIYTRSGDKGMTRVVGGDRQRKDSLLVESYGEVDELNSHIGLLRALASQHAALSEASAPIFQTIQNDLFDIGALLATMPDNKDLAARLDAFKNPLEDGSDQRIKALEQQIDAWNEHLPELNSFVLPGGGLVNAQANVARTVCRRLERLLVQRQDTYPVEPVMLAYINRLSDFLFVYGRWASAQLGEAELLWDLNR
jgi:cob(I)alamin adenosyltransferase